MAATPGNRTVGLFRRVSADGPWEHLRQGLPENAEIRALVVHPRDESRLFAATQVGPYRSSDGGQSWTSMDLPVAQVTGSLWIHPLEPEMLLCGTVDDGVFRTDDGGRHWRQLH